MDVPFFSREKNIETHLRMKVLYDIVFRYVYLSMFYIKCSPDRTKLIVHELSPDYSRNGRNSIIALTKLSFSQAKKQSITGSG